eukprot:c2354_g1_i1.p1 GENE.c2354_g1_i1~~c2354_g1_i1.p1  ORF type:complete len:341 (+),score=83.18 c2354_g1_i1:32-1024(+)
MSAPAGISPNCKTLLASTIAQTFCNEIREAVTKLAPIPPPTLVVFLANTDPAATTYAEFTGKACSEVGINFELRTVDRNQLEEAIEEANADPAVHGIMVYYPVFGAAQDQYIQNCVDPRKDVEGLSHSVRANMYNNVRYLDPPHNLRKCILPCTPLAVVKVLEHLHIYNPVLPYGGRLYGKTIAVVNRSEVVGRPLAALLANDGAKVYSIDILDVQEFHRGPGLHRKQHEVVETNLSAEDALSRADVVITGVPSSHYKCPVQALKDGVVAINFSTFKNFDDAEIKSRASIFVPSIGKVTVAMLQRNLLRLYSHQLADREQQQQPTLEAKD